MPVQLSYPGVYIEEIPSGVRTIMGVPTSVTAFVGRAKRGPVNKPMVINSFGDFERIFGGLWKESLMSYSVRDFYANGGSRAVIVRLFHSEVIGEQAIKEAASAIGKAIDDAGDNIKKACDNAKDALQGLKGPAKEAGEAIAKAVCDAASKPEAKVDSLKVAADEAAKKLAIPDKSRLVVEELNLEAKYEGKWGESLRAAIDLDAPLAEDAGLPKDTLLFNLTVKDLKTGITERHINLTIDDNDVHGVAKVLKSQSNLVICHDDKPAISKNVTDAFDAGNKKSVFEDPVSKAEKEFDLKRTEFSKIEIQLSEAIKKYKLSGEDPALKEIVDRLTQDKKELEEKVNEKEKALSDELDKTKSSDGRILANEDFIVSNTKDTKTGLYALEDTDIFNLLCIPMPPAEDLAARVSLMAEAAKYCTDRRAMLIVDPPQIWKDKDEALSGIEPIRSGIGGNKKNAAIFFPHLRQPDPIQNNQVEFFVPCGAVAGTFARTDTNRGVWKAPAGLDAALNGVTGLNTVLTDAENGELNPLGINCIRYKPPAGHLIWGARTLDGDDRLASEWKYIPIRRLALYIEESLFRGTQWVVFEPNDEPLWAQIRLNVGAFMHSLFRQGAFQGSSPRDAYFVKCDKETTTQNDIDRGIVNILVGFAPLKPAEFVVIKIQQMAGQIET